MKLKEEKVDQIARKILKDVVEKAKASITVEHDAILHEIKKIILDDLKREDELDEAVHKMLKANIDKIQGKNVSYNDLFKKGKIQLAREKKIIL